jgi:ATP-dependent Clp protease protease subunit
MIAENTGKAPEQVKIDSGRGHRLTAKGAMEYGLIDAIWTKREDV